MSNSGTEVNAQREMEQLIKMSKEASKISPKEYAKHDVKRGLRNSNGTGVKVGVTRIASVVGYDVVDDKIIPIPGEMHYRGIDLADMVEGLDKEGRLGYEEVVYLLLFDKLPTRSELNYFESLLNQERDLPENFKENVILNQPSNHIMNYLQRMILSLYSYSENPDDTSLSSLLEKGLKIIAKMPTMMAYGYMAQQHYFNHDSLILHSPIYASSAENILHMVRRDSTYTKEEVQILDLLLMVHAEHGGGNNSAFTTNVISSSGTDIFSTLAAAVGSLKGVKHGGANLKATEMLNNIADNVSDWHDEAEIEAYLNKILDGRAYDGSGLIYGMGHAVYTVSDPRAVMLKQGLEEMTLDTEWADKLAFVKLIESTTKKVMKQRKGEDFQICANVDLYSGVVYEMLNIPPELYTPIFATARMVGWVAHILEQTSDGKIMRPAYETIHKDMEYIPLAERKGTTK